MIENRVKRSWLARLNALALAVGFGLAGEVLYQPGSAHAANVRPDGGLSIRGPLTSSSSAGTARASAVIMPRQSVATGVCAPVPSGYPIITDPSGYRFSERDFMFAQVTEQQVNAMCAKQIPLGVWSASRFQQAIGELKTALANATITDADVRLKGSGTRFFTYDTTTKSFPQTIDELKRRVAAAHVGDSQQQRLIDEAVLVYQNNGYANPGALKPKHSFFDALYLLNLGPHSDYDLQLVSHQLALRFEDYITKNPYQPVLTDNDTDDIEPNVSPHGMHYKYKYLQFVAPPLYTWMTNWSAMLSFPARDVTIATFDANPTLPGRGKAHLSANDWILIQGPWPNS